MIIPFLRPWAFLICVAAGVPSAQAASLSDPLERPALTMHHATRAVLLDIATAGKRLAAVGERGIVLMSDDDGRTWRQSQVPVSVTLTAVHFPSPTKGWAVGHAGVILHSADGGATWTKQFDGVKAAEIAVAAGADHRLTVDGPDKPFLGVHFLDDTTGFAVGAFGLAFKTSDGGRSWQSWMGRIDNPSGRHLNAIKAGGNTIYIAGEQGYLARSSDGGEHFNKVATPYGGTFFALAVSPEGQPVVGGLRGHVLMAGPDGSWREVAGLPDASVTALAWQGDELLLANQAGRLFVVGEVAAPVSGQPLPPIAGVVPAASGGIVVVGMAGAFKVGGGVP